MVVGVVTLSHAGEVVGVGGVSRGDAGGGSVGEVSGRGRKVYDG